MLILDIPLAGSRFRIKDTTGVREVNVPTGSNFYNDEIAWHEVLNIGDSTAIFLNYGTQVIELGLVEPKDYQVLHSIMTMI